MKVLLREDVDNLGKKGDLVDVADGYARNYLIPRRMAIRAEKGALKQAESLKRGHNARLSKQKVEFETLASKLIAQGALQISARAGDEGKLFGSVTAADIAAAVTAQSGVAVDRRDVHLEEPIRSIGTHEVRVKLFHEVEPVITVEVITEG